MSAAQATLRADDKGGVYGKKSCMCQKSSPASSDMVGSIIEAK